VYWPDAACHRSPLVDTDKKMLTPSRQPSNLKIKNASIVTVIQRVFTEKNNNKKTVPGKVAADKKKLVTLT
jgi:hypothetical protein